MARRASDVVQNVAVAIIWPNCFPPAYPAAGCSVRSKMLSLVNEQADWSSLKQARRRGTVGRGELVGGLQVPDPEGLVDGRAHGRRSEFTSVITLRSALMSLARDVLAADR